MPPYREPPEPPTWYFEEGEDRENWASIFECQMCSDRLCDSCLHASVPEAEEEG